MKKYTYVKTNRLKINADKTEFLLITSPYKTITRPIQISTGQEVTSPLSSHKSLGVMLNKHLAMDTHKWRVYASPLNSTSEISERFNT